MYKMRYFVPGLAIALVGCTATYKPLRDSPIGSVPAKALVADYRLVTLQPNPKDLDADQHHNAVLCAEPSPDIARAFSQALSASLSADVAKTATAGMTAAAAFQSQSAQAIAQLGKRYATVQVLRDILHDQCVQYANGTMSEATWALMQSRFNSLVVTLLSIEMVSGDTAPAAVNVKADVSGAPADPTTTTPGNKVDADAAGSDSPGAAKIPLDQAKTKASATVSDVKKKSAALSSAVTTVDKASKAATAAAAASGAASATQTQAKNLDASSKAFDKVPPVYAKAIAALNAAWVAASTQGGAPDANTKDLITQFQKSLPKDDDATLKSASDAATTAATKETKAATSAMTNLSKSLATASTQLASYATAKAPTTSQKKDTSTDVKDGQKLSDAQAAAIDNIHARYIQKEDLGPSLLACFTYLDPPGHKDPSRTTDAILSHYCSDAFRKRLELFNTTGADATQIIASAPSQTPEEAKAQTQAFNDALAEHNQGMTLLGHLKLDPELLEYQKKHPELFTPPVSKATATPATK